MNSYLKPTGGYRKFLIIGVIIAVLLAISALLIPSITSLAIEMLVGILVLLAGFVRMFWAFRSASIGKGSGLFVLGIVSVVTGIAIVSHPFYERGSLTTILTLYFLFDGGVEIVMSRLVAPMQGYGWLMTGGVISVVLGLMIWLQYPIGGVWAIAILLAIKILMIGMIMVMTKSVPLFYTGN